MHYRFCLRVRAGAIPLVAHDLPSFLYPEGGYSAEDPDEHIFLSPFLAKVNLLLSA